MTRIGGDERGRWGYLIVSRTPPRLSQISQLASRPIVDPLMRRGWCLPPEKIYIISYPMRNDHWRINQPTNLDNLPISQSVKPKLLRVIRELSDGRRVHVGVEEGEALVGG